MKKIDRRYAHISLVRTLQSINVEKIMIKAFASIRLRHTVATYQWILKNSTQNLSNIRRLVFGPSHPIYAHIENNFRILYQENLQ